MNVFKHKLGALLTKYQHTTTLFELENGKKFIVQMPHCLGCVHCSDVFYDAKPYATLCKLNKENTRGFCLKFELNTDETITFTERRKDEQFCEI